MPHPALDRLKVLPQYLVPQHLLSRAIGLLAESHWPPIKNGLIDFFLKRYGIDMSIAEQEDPHAFACFNDFFTRALKPGMRPIAEQGIACPADGAISQLGPIRDDQIFQAKGHYYSLSQLLGGDESMAAQFRNGHFATVYLSPKDYHRVHMPYTGTLKKMIHVPGKLFSVNTLTAQQVPGLFARNERVVCLFETDIGPMVVILVGAMIVASIETVWEGLVTPYKPTVKHFDYQTGREEIQLPKGAEMGRFKLGSTAIILFAEAKVEWGQALSEGLGVRMGEAMGTIQQP